MSVYDKIKYYCDSQEIMFGIKFNDYSITTSLSQLFSITHQNIIRVTMDRISSILFSRTVQEALSKEIVCQMVMVDVTTLKMARKPVKLQKENLAGCTGEGKQSKGN